MSGDVVIVLLAAYNGDRFIADQIESILRQELRKGLDLSVIVGVDPSEDETCSQVREFCERDSRVKMICHDSPSGSAQAHFSRLMLQARGASSRYFCFSDQDDVWHEDKLLSSLDKMTQMEAGFGEDVPMLVFSDSRLVAADLSLIFDSFWASDRLSPVMAASFKRLAFQNVGQGASFFFNRPLLELSAPIPIEARMHDHWVMLVASVFGEVGFVDRPTLSYRQHEKNVLGARGHGLFQSIGRFLSRRRAIVDAILASEKQADIFLKRYECQLPPEVRGFFYQMATLNQKSFLYRRWFLFRHGIRMSSFDRTVGLYFLV